MKTFLWCGMLSAAILLIGCNTTITDNDTPVNNRSANNNYANHIDSKRLHNSYTPSHGNADTTP